MPNTDSPRRPNARFFGRACRLGYLVRGWLTGFEATMWKRLATGRPISAAERWAKSGMPVTREGGRVHASAEDLNPWPGRESAGELRSRANPPILLPD